MNATLIIIQKNIFPSNQLYDPSTHSHPVDSVVIYQCGSLLGGFEVAEQDIRGAVAYTCMENQTWAPVGALPPCVCKMRQFI